MKRPNSALLSKALHQYGLPFESTLTLVDSLVKRREYPNEVLILLCARIDALASDSVIEGTPSRQAFERLLHRYSGRRELFESISVGDLYWEIGFHRWKLEGTVVQPGRLHRFSDVDDPIIHLFEDAGLPLTAEHCARLLDTLMRILREQFQVRPRQRAKLRYVHPKRLKEVIVGEFRKSRLHRIADSLAVALEPLVSSKRISTLLYRRFRCDAIHGAAVRLNEERFFNNQDVYWEPLYSEYYGAFELVAFSAKFLATCLRTCLNGFRSHMIEKGTIPPAIHFHAFEDVVSNVELLDQSLIPEGGRVRLKLAR